MTARKITGLAGPAGRAGPIGATGPTGRHGGTNLTDWVYRGGSFAAVLAMVTWWGLRLIDGQATLSKDFNDMHFDFQQKLLDLRNDMQAQNATTNNGVTILTAQVGQNSGAITMIKGHLEHKDAADDIIRDRVTRLEAERGIK